MSDVCILVKRLYIGTYVPRCLARHTLFATPLHANPGFGGDIILVDRETSTTPPLRIGADSTTIYTRFLLWRNTKFDIARVHARPATVTIFFRRLSVKTLKTHPSPCRLFAIACLENRRVVALDSLKNVSRVRRGDVDFSNIRCFNKKKKTKTIAFSTISRLLATLRKKNIKLQLWFARVRKTRNGPEKAYSMNNNTRGAVIAYVRERR